MRNLRTSAAIALLFVAAAASLAGPHAAAQAATSIAASHATPAGMQSYTSKDGRFSVLFPGTPQQSSQQINLNGGGSATLYQIWVEDDSNVTYMVMYNDYPPNYANDGADNVLARTRDGAADGKTLTTDVGIGLNGVPGRAFTVYDKQWNYAVHQFLDGKRLFQLIVVSSKDHPATQVEEFMNSFRIQ